jgi:hypothetical protein
MARPDRQTRSPKAQGRRLAVIVYYAMVVLVGGSVAVQITRQVFFEPAAPPPYATCHDGLRALFDAMARAREAAAGSAGGEDAALARFRSALEPEWGYRDGIASRCQVKDNPAATPEDARTLDAIERLRYAEEHAVRREAGELAPLRRRVQALVDSELGRIEPGSSFPSPPPPGPRPARLDTAHPEERQGALPDGNRNQR